MAEKLGEFVGGGERRDAGAVFSALRCGRLGMGGDDAVDGGVVGRGRRQGEKKFISLCQINKRPKKGEMQEEKADFFIFFMLRYFSIFFPFGNR